MIGKGRNRALAAIAEDVTSPVFVADLRFVEVRQALVPHSYETGREMFGRYLQLKHRTGKALSDYIFVRALWRVAKPCRAQVDEHPCRVASAGAVSRVLQWMERKDLIFGHWLTDHGARRYGPEIGQRLHIWRCPAWGLSYRAVPKKGVRSRVVRTPSWADLKAIAAVYEQAAVLRKSRGIACAVDHIYPVCGKTVSGLHVAENLQIITKKENSRKGNKHPEEFYGIDMEQLIQHNLSLTLELAQRWAENHGR